MNKLDTQLLEILLANNGTFDQVIYEIKQSILKAIMKVKPKKLGVSSLDNTDREYKFYNQALEKFESVIKEVLGEQEEVKGKFMPYNPNNY